jgi:hypothetical protein
LGQRLGLPAARSELARFDPPDRLKHSAQGSLDDRTAIEATLRWGINLKSKLVRGPDWARIEFVSRLQNRYAPSLLVVGDGPVERGGAPIALDAGMHDQAEMARPNFLRNGNFQHRRNDQIRRLAGNSGDHRLARRCDADADIVAAFDELDPKTLAETVVGRG